MPAPLDGLFVLDASWGSSGSIATMLLADYGATVVKIERPGGAVDAASVNRKAWDRSKWSIELDLTAAEGVAKLRELQRRADVFVESMGPGRADKLGYGYRSSSADNRELVYLALSGYGQDETPWRDRPGWEALVTARLGYMAEQPGHRHAPVFLGHPSVAYSTAFQAVIGVLSALRHVQRTGQGQLVDVSLMDGVTGQAALNWWWNERDDSYLSTPAQGTYGYKRLIFEMFRCADDQYIMMHTGGDGGFKAALTVLGFGDQIREVGVGEMGVLLDEDEYQIARNKVPDAFLSRPRDEWLRLFEEVDVAATPVLRPTEAFDHPQIVHHDLIMKMPDDSYGELEQIKPTITFTRSPWSLPSPAPTVGQHDGRLGELLQRPAKPGGSEPPATVEPGGALENIRILDFSQYFAAGYGARILSDLGADVIKVETPSRDPMRALSDPFEGAQRGKRAICLDLRNPDGRAAVYDLVRTADVVVHNFRPGKAEKVGLGYEALREINPNLIYMYQPGWGADGPYSGRKSFAPLMSGLVGLMYVAAGVGNPPVRRARASEDYYGGFMGAIATLLALRHRDRTGEGQYVESPQLCATMFVTSEFQRTADGRMITGHQLNGDQTGYTPGYRLYQTSDGWICVAAMGSRAFNALRAALDLGDELVDGDHQQLSVSSAEESPVELALAKRFAEFETTEALERLERHGVAAELARAEPFMPELWWEEWALGAGRVFEHHHAEFGWVREIGLTIRMSGTPGVKKGAAPLFGEHTEAVLREIGLSAEKVAELVAGGAAIGLPAE